MGGLWMFCTIALLAGKAIWDAGDALCVIDNMRLLLYATL
jgi:hypothetical protein